MLIGDRIKELRRVPASTLRANPSNWRKHPKLQQQHMEQLLKEIGFAGALLAREDNGAVTLIDGHLRKDLCDGDQLVPVLILDVSEEEADQILATYDPIAAMATADKEQLEAVLTRIAAEENNLQDLVNHIASENKITLPGLPGTGGLTDPDSVPETPEKPTTQPGDLYTLGKHRLLCGDATRLQDVSLLMGEEKADLMVTDPPYGVAYASKNEFLNTIDKGNANQEEIEGDHQKPEDMAAFWKDAFSTIRTALSPGAAYYLTGPQGGDLLLLLLLALRDSDFPLRHMLIWAKNNHVLGRCDYHYKHEPIIYGWVKGSHKFYGEAGETSLWEIPKPQQSKLHPTMKPVELFNRAVHNSSQHDDLVLDPFLGSGTTLIAATQLNRRCYALEIEPRYCDVSVRRWEEFTGQKAEITHAQ